MLRLKLISTKTYIYRQWNYVVSDFTLLVSIIFFKNPTRVINTLSRIKIDEEKTFINHWNFLNFKFGPVLKHCCYNKQK